MQQSLGHISQAFMKKIVKEKYILNISLYLCTRLLYLIFSNTTMEYNVQSASSAHLLTIIKMHKTSVWENFASKFSEAFLKEVTAQVDFYLSYFLPLYPLLRQLSLSLQFFLSCVKFLFNTALSPFQELLLLFFFQLSQVTNKQINEKR